MMPNHGMFSERAIFRKNTSEVQELERDSLRTTQAYIPLGKSFLLPSVHIVPRWEAAASGACAPLDDTCNEYLLHYTKPLFACT